MDDAKLKELEFKNDEDKKKKSLLILMLGIITILVAIIGASFAYFTTVVNNVKGKQSFVMSTTTIEGVSYQASDNLALYNAIPGESNENTFTITNPNSAATVRYTLKFIADINEFTSQDGPGQLLITVSGGDIIEPVILDFTDGENAKEMLVTSNVILEPSESDVYKMRIEFVETNSTQNSNQSKTFSGHIEIKQSIVVDK